MNDNNDNNDTNDTKVTDDKVESNKSPVKERLKHSYLYSVAGDPTDGRMPYEWCSGYHSRAWREIWLEAFYLFILLILSHFLIFATWKGWISSYLSITAEQSLTLKRYGYYVASGMLGGAAFATKHLYRSVARGRWHQDRRIWRLKSPLIGMSIALIIGAMADASLITKQIPFSGPAFVSIGFLAGYFADHAVAKMHEVAQVIFGKSEVTKDEVTKDKDVKKVNNIS